MAHADPHTPPLSSAERRRRAEPYVFFFGTMGAILIAIILIIAKSHEQVGPDSAQRSDVAAHGH